MSKNSNKGAKSAGSKGSKKVFKTKYTTITVYTKRGEFDKITVLAHPKSIIELGLNPKFKDVPKPNTVEEATQEALRNIQDAGQAWQHIKSALSKYFPNTPEASTSKPVEPSDDIFVDVDRKYGANWFRVLCRKCGGYTENNVPIVKHQVGCSICDIKKVDPYRNGEARHDFSHTPTPPWSNGLESKAESNVSKK